MATSRLLCSVYQEPSVQLGTVDSPRESPSTFRPTLPFVLDQHSVPSLANPPTSYPI